MKSVFTNGSVLLLLAGLGGGSVRVTAQVVNPGVTAVPARIVAEVDPDVKAEDSLGDADLLTSGTSPLQRLNEELPQSVQFSLIDRTRFEGYSGLNFKAGKGTSDSYLLNRFRFGMLLKPQSWFKIYTEGQDAHAFFKTLPIATSYQDTWDLRQAFVELGGAEGQPWDVKVGRQELNFGAGRLIGKSDWRNGGRTFDAALAKLHEGRFRLSAFSSSIVALQGYGISHHQEGYDIHGLYGGIDDLIPHSVLEPYFFWHLAPGAKANDGTLGKLDEKTVGLRWAGMVTNRFDYAAEAAGQYGSLSDDSISARATWLTAGYTLTDTRLKPRFFADFFYGSGNHNPHGDTHATFDELYPTVHDRNGLADQLGWQNLKEFRTGTRLFLTRHWALAGIYNDWYLASAKDALYNSTGGVIVVDPSGNAGTHIGQEFDFETSFRLNAEVELGTGIGHILPGAFLKATTPGHPYTYPYFQVNFTL
jgi:hypothetical protein